jgi:acetylornithine deacetylase/succinyl-diaminopimelate desuccinylase-like protein
MIALKAIARSGIDLRGTLIFGSEVGEDGGIWRIDELLDGPGACDIGICGEPTKLEIHLGCRGTFPLRVRTIGRATHTGTAYTGVNAIQKMCAVIPALYDLPCFHRVDPIWGRSPINAMIISGGGKVSASVPDECICRFDIRLNPDLSPAALDAELEGAFARLRAADPELRFEVEKTIRTDDRTYNGRSASSIPADDPLVGAVGDAIEQVLGKRPQLAGFPGGCSIWSMSDRGVRSIIFGPGNLEQAHTVDEWIEVEQIYQAAKVYATIAYNLLVG